MVGAFSTRYKMRKMQGKRKWNYHAFQKFLEISMENVGEQDWCRTVLTPPSQQRFFRPGFFDAQMAGFRQLSFASDRSVKEIMAVSNFAYEILPT
jgi:hypothetical protein